MQSNANFDLYYDAHHIATTTSIEWEPHSLHCTCELVPLKTDSADDDWASSINAYICTTRKVHMLQMEQEHKKADEHFVSSAALLDTFGSHLWYLVQNDSGMRTKIRAPLFGIDGYLRISLYPSKIQYDHIKLQRVLQTRVMLMLSVMSDEAVSLNSEQLNAHLLFLSRCMQLIMKVPRTDSDPCRLVGEFFNNMDELGSPLGLFYDLDFRRQLDQACAIES